MGQRLREPLKRRRRPHRTPARTHRHPVRHRHHRDHPRRRLPTTQDRRSTLNRLPIRLRLTLAFAGVMAVVLTATGLFLYVQLRADLDHTINQGLRSRAGDISALVQQADTELRDAATTPPDARQPTSRRTSTPEAESSTPPPDYANRRYSRAPRCTPHSERPPCLTAARPSERRHGRARRGLRGVAGRRRV